VIVAHVAGVPFEELVPLAVVSGADIVVALRARLSGRRRTR
jgi:hypothetical protein